MPYGYTRPWATDKSDTDGSASESDSENEDEEGSSGEPGRRVLIPYGVYSYPDTPAGNLRTSAAQLGRFLAMFAGGGCGADGVRLLQPETVVSPDRCFLPASLVLTRRIVSTENDDGAAVPGRAEPRRRPARCPGHRLVLRARHARALRRRPRCDRIPHYDCNADFGPK